MAPFASIQKRQAAQREYAKRKRAGESLSRRLSPALADLQLATARDALNVLRGELQRVVDLCTEEDSAIVMNRARCVASILVTALRAIEIVDLLPRLEALEAQAQEKTRWPQ